MPDIILKTGTQAVRGAILHRKILFFTIASDFFLCYNKKKEREKRGAYEDLYCGDEGVLYCSKACKCADFKDCFRLWQQHKREN